MCVSRKCRRQPGLREPVVINLNPHLRGVPDQIQARPGGSAPRDIESNHIIAHINDDTSIPIIEDTPVVIIPSAPNMVRYIQTGDVGEQFSYRRRVRLI
jgi:hypothetical protein